MKKLGIIISIVCFVLTISPPAFLYGKDLKPGKPIFRHLSDVVGIVECSNQEPVTRALVYIVGESFMAKTDDEGRFTLHAVPPGRYNLEIETMDNITAQIPIDVSKKMTIDLGFIEVDCSPSIITCQSNNDCPEGMSCEENRCLL
jgi:hypothetical protein